MYGTTAPKTPRPGRYDDLLAAHELPAAPVATATRDEGPELPEKDLLGFIATHSPVLEPWQRDVVAMIREEMLYFVPQMRPKNATRKCGVAWLPADPDGDGAGRPDTGLLLTRNVLPSADFKKSSWSVTSPFNAKEIMGDYYPKGNYMAKKAFESHGCPFKWK